MWKISSTLSKNNKNSRLGVEHGTAGNFPSKNINNLQKFLISSDNDLRKLPPGREVLTLHIKRACLVAGYLWRESVEDFQLPEFTLWGWFRNEDGSYRPLWEAQVGNVKYDKFVMICSCAAQKCKNCKCSKAKVTCIAMCGCDRKCTSN